MPEVEGGYAWYQRSNPDFYQYSYGYSMPDYWISIVHAQYGIPVAAGVTSVSAPQYYAYVESGQLNGMLGGMKGAAEYEALVGKPAKATAGMTAQSLVHLFIIFSVIGGNAIFIASKRKKSGAAA